ncbi:MAG: cell division protein FtsQ/DivIB, partial [Microthrixaceae bacterium]
DSSNEDSEIDLRESPVHPRIAGRRDEVISDERIRRSRYRMAGLCVALVLTAAVGVMFSPLFDMDHLLVEGVQDSAAQEVSDATGLNGGTALFSVDASNVRARIEDVPWIAHAAVNVTWPDRVEVLATPHRPVANVASDTADPAAFATATGEVLAYDDALPLVPFAGALPVLRLPDADYDPEQLREALMALELFGPETLASADELVIDDAGDLLLTVTGGAAQDAEVAIGSTEDLPEKAQAIESVLSGVVETRCMATLDVSVPARITIERVPQCELPAPQQVEDR